MPSILAMLGQGKTVRDIARATGTPEQTISRWGLEPAWASQYAQAREDGWHRMADDCLELADACYGRDADFVQGARLRVDTRKWLLSKMLPGIFGDRLQVDMRAMVAVAFTKLGVSAQGDDE